MQVMMAEWLHLKVELSQVLFITGGLCLNHALDIKLKNFTFKGQNG